MKLTLFRYLAGCCFLVTLACQRSSAREEVAPSPVASSEPVSPPTKRTHILAHGQLGPGRGTLIVDIKAPPGGVLTEGAPLMVHAKGEHLTFPKPLRTKLEVSALPIRLTVDVEDGAMGPAELDLMYYFCQDGKRGSCRPERANLEVSIDLTGTAPGGEAHFTHQPIL